MANEPTEGAVRRALDVVSLLSLMAGMRQNGVAYLEVGDLKMSLAPPERPNAQGVGKNPQPTVEQAMKAAQAAREAAFAQRDAQMEARKGRLAARATGGIGPNTAKLVDDLVRSVGPAPLGAPAVPTTQPNGEPETGDQPMTG